MCHVRSLTTALALAVAAAWEGEGREDVTAVGEDEGMTARTESSARSATTTDQTHTSARARRTAPSSRPGRSPAGRLVGSAARMMSVSIADACEVAERPPELRPSPG